ncbi:hypothetical protein VMCG_10236 [Cytospora schulzeri]|uniref:Uncharacterized protein n=1 Tax=Cytospora schulzeri TaxID=448051 RepID=A0A423VEQ1_9PEZI|nr:hypothetical protein VMCG_10236 [Valsa malicola]
MEQLRGGGQEPAGLLDIRVQIQKHEELAFDALVDYWPSVPGRDSTGEESAVDCMAIIAKIYWAKIIPSSRPQPQADESEFSRYIWLLFEEKGMSGSWPLRDSARNRVVSVIRRELGPDFTFETLCRSKIVVDSLWASPDNQLTYPEIKQGPEHPHGTIVCSGAEMATKGFLEWDGVSCPSLADLTSRVTKETQLPDNNKLFVYLQRPSLLEVRFTPGAGCKLSLRDLFQFSTDYWVPYKLNESLSRLRKEGKQAYMLMAVVKHRKSPQDADCVRVFFEDGMELLPALAANNPMPDWGFKADESIPSGTKLSLYYIPVPHLSPGVVITERKMIYTFPDHMIQGVRDFGLLFDAKGLEES